MWRKGKKKLEVGEVIQEVQITLQPKPQAKKILDSKVKKKTTHYIYMEHLITWKDKPESEATWIAKSEFKKIRTPTKLLQDDPPQVSCYMGG